MEIRKTLKLKLIPLTKRDKAEVVKLFKEYRVLVKDALQIIMASDARSRKRTHDLCYRVLREKYPHIHNKFVEEAYKRALAMYKSYRRLLRRWERGKLRGKPSQPTVNELRVVDLHIDTFRIEQNGHIYVFRVSRGSRQSIRFIMLMYNYALNQLWGARIGNSKLLFDGGEIYLLLTIVKDVETKLARNKFYIDVNEDSVAALLIDFDRGFATLFSIRYNVSRIRISYRNIRRGIQKKVDDPYVRNRLLAKYGAGERNKVEDRLKKTAHTLGEVAENFDANLVREGLRDLRNNGRRKRKSKNKKLNYRLETFPYRKFFTYLDTELVERKLTVEEVDARGTSITCPICRYSDKRNRVDRETFRCGKCGFTLNAHYIACLNLFSRHNDGMVAISGGRIMLITHEAGQVVPVYEASHDPTKNEWVLRGKPVLIISKITQTIKITQLMSTGNHILSLFSDLETRS